MFNQKEYSRKYYLQNKDKWVSWAKENKCKKNETQREYMRRNYKERAAYKRSFVEKNYEWNLWIQSKRSARNKELEHSIKISDIIIPDICPYLNIPLTRTQGQGIVWTNASIDRIDNTKGYSKNNIQIISRLANSMKRDVSIEQLLQFARSVLEIHKED